jgi:Arc/MetJ family transcription regulator
MRTTLDIPELLMEEAMKLTHITVKNDLIMLALHSLIQTEKAKDISAYFGKVPLDIDLDEVRKRRSWN